MSPRAVLAAALAVVCAATACNAGTAGRPAASPSVSRPAADVVVAPLLTVQFLYREGSAFPLPIGGVVQERGGRLVVRLLTCRPRAPRCEASTEEVAGTLRVPSRPGERYVLKVETADWRIDLTGTGARATALVERCPYPAQGATIEVYSTDHDAITWTGTVNGKPYDRLACNYYARSGTARITSSV